MKLFTTYTRSFPINGPNLASIAPEIIAKLSKHHTVLILAKLDKMVGEDNIAEALLFVANIKHFLPIYQEILFVFRREDPGIFIKVKERVADRRSIEHTAHLWIGTQKGITHTTQWYERFLTAALSNVYL